MNSVYTRIKLLERELDSLNELGSKILIPRRIKSRQQNLLRIIYKKIYLDIENGSIGDLDLSETPIIELPKELVKVGGNLDLRNCTSLKSLPDNLKVDGDLYLRNCTSLISLPNNLKVDGGLYLSNCTSLISLPDNLKVDRSLNLDSCASLISLPDNLKVDGYLYLRNTPISKKYNTQELIKNYLESINADVSGDIYI